LDGAEGAIAVAISDDLAGLAWVEDPDGVDFGDGCDVEVDEWGVWVVDEGHRLIDCSTRFFVFFPFFGSFGTSVQRVDGWYGGVRGGLVVGAPEADADGE